VAGAIARGLGGHLAARSDTEHYVSERAREEREVRDIPSAEAAELTTVLTSYGLTAEESAPVVMALRKRPEAWVDLMMRFELGIERPNPGARCRVPSQLPGLTSLAASSRLRLISRFPEQDCARLFRHRHRRCTHRVRIRERILHRSSATAERELGWHCAVQRENYDLWPNLG
jgi:VIT family